MDIKLSHYLDEVEEASKRARKVFLVMVFSSLAILIAFINSLPTYMNWFESRIDNFRRAERYFYFNGDTINVEDQQYLYSDSIRNINSLAQFININESQFAKDSEILKVLLQKYQLNLVENNIKFKSPKFVGKIESNLLSKNINERFEVYDAISISLNNLVKHSIFQRTTYNTKIQSLNDAELNKIMFVHVPILGLSFDINNLGVFSGLLLSVLYWLLYASLQREHVNTKISFRKGWEEIVEDRNKEQKRKLKLIETGVLENPPPMSTLHPYDFYEYISMKQVLDIPQKLFVPSKKSWFNSIGKNILFIPIFVFVLVFTFDLFPTFSAGTLTNAKLTSISIGFEFFLLILCFIAFISVLSQWSKMSILWETQAHSYNLEFILECIKEDFPRDLMKYAQNIKLNETDRENVIETWNYYWSKGKKRTIFKKAYYKNVFKKFIDDSINGNFKKLSNRSNLNLELSWKLLKEWHTSYGRLNVNDDFYETLIEMVFEKKI